MGGVDRCLCRLCRLKQVAFGRHRICTLGNYRYGGGYPQPVIEAALSFLISVFTCILLFLPWQIFILTKFPGLADYEYHYNSRHIWEVLEGHEGDIGFYLNYFPNYFGWQINYLVPLGLILVLANKSLFPSHKIGLITRPVIVFCFFSFWVQTKVQGYFYMVVPLCILLSGYALRFLRNGMGSYARYAVVPGLIVCTYYSLNFKQIQSYTSEVNYRGNKLYNTIVYKRLDQIIPDSINIVVNANNQEHVDIMFYSKRLEAYHTLISEVDFRKIAARHIPLAAFPSREHHVLPEYIANYKYLYVIHEELR